MKQCQREALTREKQSLMATGGGPQEAGIDIDPDIARIAPYLMKTAPVLFTSNMTEKEVNGIYKNNSINYKCISLQYFNRMQLNSFEYCFLI